MKRNINLLIISLLMLSLFVCGCKKKEDEGEGGIVEPAGIEAEEAEKMEEAAEGQKKIDDKLIGKEVKEEVAAVGNEAPDFTLQNYDGNDITLSDYEDMIVVLEWFNYDCPFVKYHYEEDNTMIETADTYKNNGVEWFAINSTNYATPKTNKEYAEKHKVPYPILDDSSGKVGRMYDAERTPHMFIIDKGGVIVYEGAIDNAPMGEDVEEYTNYVDQALMELINGKEVSTKETDPYGCTVKYKD